MCDVSCDVLNKALLSFVICQKYTVVVTFNQIEMLVLPKIKHNLSFIFLINNHDLDFF